ncbi:MAG TPA: cell envelope integrity protein TolA [Candidatus Saccharimonadales bacterium]|nr:cell envelope integrity protein TolA [Candidatus Saccharimonadales bacterium]
MLARLLGGIPAQAPRNMRTLDPEMYQNRYQKLLPDKLEGYQLYQDKFDALLMDFNRDFPFSSSENKNENAADDSSLFYDRIGAIFRREREAGNLKSAEDAYNILKLLYRELKQAYDLDKTRLKQQANRENEAKGAEAKGGNEAKGENPELDPIFSAILKKRTDLALKLTENDPQGNAPFFTETKFSDLEAFKSGLTRGLITLKTDGQYVFRSDERVKMSPFTGRPLLPVDENINFDLTFRYVSFVNKIDESFNKTRAQAKETESLEIIQEKHSLVLNQPALLCDAILKDPESINAFLGIINPETMRSMFPHDILLPLLICTNHPKRLLEIWPNSKDFKNAILDFMKKKPEGYYPNAVAQQFEQSKEKIFNAIWPQLQGDMHVFDPLFVLNFINNCCPGDDQQKEAYFKQYLHSSFIENDREKIIEDRNKNNRISVIARHYMPIPNTTIISKEDREIFNKYPLTAYEIKSLNKSVAVTVSQNSRKEKVTYTTKGLGLTSEGDRAVAYTQIANCLTDYNNTTWDDLRSLELDIHFRANAGYKGKPNLKTPGKEGSLSYCVNNLMTDIRKSTTFFMRFKKPDFLAQVISDDKCFEALTPEDLSFIWEYCQTANVPQYNRFLFLEMLMACKRMDDPLFKFSIFYHDKEGVRHIVWLNKETIQKLLISPKEAATIGFEIPPEFISTTPEEEKAAAAKLEHRKQADEAKRIKEEQSKLQQAREKKEQPLKERNYQAEQNEIALMENILFQKFSSVLINKIPAGIPDPQRPGEGLAVHRGAEQKVAEQKAPSQFFHLPAGNAKVTFDPQDHGGGLREGKEFALWLQAFVASAPNGTVFSGVLNHGSSHFIPYFIYKNLNGEIQVICVDPSAKLTSDPEHDGKTKTRKELESFFKREVFPQGERFPTSCEFQDPNITLQINESDCAFNAFTVLEDAYRGAAGAMPLLIFDKGKLCFSEEGLRTNGNRAGYHTTTEAKHAVDGSAYDKYTYTQAFIRASETNRKAWNSQLHEAKAVYRLQARAEGQPAFATDFEFVMINNNYSYENAVKGQEFGDELNIIRGDVVAAALQIFDEIKKEFAEKLELSITFRKNKIIEIEEFLKKSYPDLAVTVEARGSSNLISKLIDITVGTTGNPESLEKAICENFYQYIKAEMKSKDFKNLKTQADRESWSRKKVTDYLSSANVKKLNPNQIAGLTHQLDLLVFKADLQNNLMRFILNDDTLEKWLSEIEVDHTKTFDILVPDIITKLIEKLRLIPPYNEITLDANDGTNKVTQVLKNHVETLSRRASRETAHHLSREIAKLDLTQLATCLEKDNKPGLFAMVSLLPVKPVEIKAEHKEEKTAGEATNQYKHSLFRNNAVNRNSALFVLSDQKVEENHVISGMVDKQIQVAVDQRLTALINEHEAAINQVLVTALTPDALKDIAEQPDTVEKIARNIVATHPSFVALRTAGESSQYIDNTVLSFLTEKLTEKASPSIAKEFKDISQLILAKLDERSMQEKISGVDRNKPDRRSVILATVISELSEDKNMPENKKLLLKRMIASANLRKKFDDQFKAEITEKLNAIEKNSNEFLKSANSYKDFIMKYQKEMKYEVEEKKEEIAFTNCPNNDEQSIINELLFLIDGAIELAQTTTSTLKIATCNRILEDNIINFLTLVRNNYIKGNNATDLDQFMTRVRILLCQYFPVPVNNPNELCPYLLKRQVMGEKGIDAAVVGYLNQIIEKRNFPKILTLQHSLMMPEVVLKSDCNDKPPTLPADGKLNRKWLTQLVEHWKMNFTNENHYPITLKNLINALNNYPNPKNPNGSTKNQTAYDKEFKEWRYQWLQKNILNNIGTYADKQATTHGATTTRFINVLENFAELRNVKEQKIDNLKQLPVCIGDIERLFADYQCVPGDTDPEKWKVYEQAVTGCAPAEDIVKTKDVIADKNNLILRKKLFHHPDLSSFALSFYKSKPQTDASFVKDFTLLIDTIKLRRSHDTSNFHLNSDDCDLIESFIKIRQDGFYKYDQTSQEFKITLPSADQVKGSTPRAELVLAQLWVECVQKRKMSQSPEHPKPNPNPQNNVGMTPI